VTSDTVENSGRANAGITSPKFGIVLGPWYKTELFGNAGFGFHSNDLRGSTITVEPVTLVPVDRVPLLVRTKGAEVGVRTKIIDGLTSAVAVFVLDQDSELLFVGDAGTTEASRPSRRVGVEWTNDYRVNSWLTFDVDLAYTHARFTNYDPAGDRIPGAPAWVTSAAVIVGGETGWFGSAKLRYFGVRPLVEDASVYSQSSLIVNARVGYRFDSNISVYVDAFNLFNARANQIEYYYDSRLATEPSGVATADRHIHPVEPLAVRLTVAAKF
jgi:outer membrane receptor protein involved in Fe transport